MEAARDLRLRDEGLRQQVYLGDESFAQQALEESDRKLGISEVHDITRQQCSAPRTMQQWLHEYSVRAEALWTAHTHSGIKMTALAPELGLSVARVNQLIKGYEDLKFKD